LNPGQTPASSWGSFSFSLPSFPHFDFSGLSLPTPSLPSFSLPNLKLSLPNLDLSKFSFPDLAALLPSIGLDLPDWTLKLPNISLPSLSLGGGGTGGGGGGGLPSIDWANLKLPNLVFQLPRLNLAGLKVDFTKLLAAIDFGALNWPEVTLPNLNVALGGGRTTDWLNLGLSDLLTQLKGLNLPGINFTLPTSWPNGSGGTSLSGIKLPDLKLALPDIDLDWGNLTLPALLLSLPRLNIAGLSIDVDYARLLPAWPNVSLPNLGQWFKSNPSAAGSTGGLSLNLDWGKLSLPELLISLPKLNLPGFDLGLLGFGGLPNFSSASLSSLPLVGSLVDDLPFKFNFNDDGFSIYGQLGIKYQDNFTLSGNFGLDKNNTAGTISFLGQDATAKLQVGEYGIGAQGAAVALVLESTGFALEAKGELFAQLADFVQLSADEAKVQLNTTGKDYTGKVVTVGDPADGGLTYPFGALTNGM
ncbi:MAG: hypothetical protein ACO262_10270, partial [Vulcanococcus sp.]